MGLNNGGSPIYDDDYNFKTVRISAHNMATYVPGSPYTC